MRSYSFVVVFCILINFLGVEGVPVNGPVHQYLRVQLENQRQLLDGLTQLVEQLDSVAVYSKQVYTIGGPTGELSQSESPCNSTSRDCSELYENGCEVDGVYLIDPSRSGQFIKVYCDMKDNGQDGGGWTVIQRRIDDSVNFFQDWGTYEAGFGSLSGNMWLGLHSIYKLTNHDDGDITQLIIELETFDGEKKYAKYSEFYVDGYKDFYRLHVSGYYGTAGDSMAFSNNHRFSAYDVDVDSWSSNCALRHRGAWWYNACFRANLNGLYLNDAISDDKSVQYIAFKGSVSLKRVTMKVRRHPSK